MSDDRRPPARIGRRRLKVLLWIVAVPCVVVACWVLSLLVPRTRHFTARRTAVATAVAERPVVEAGGYLSQVVQLVGQNGLAVNFRVLRPAHPTKPLPVVLLLGGFETGRDAVGVVGDPGDIVVAALDYPYDGPKRLKGVWAALTSVPPIQRALLDTPPAVSLAMNWLLREPYVDPAAAELMGISLGVPFAAVAGAMDARFRRVWLVHGGIDNRAWLANRLESRIASPGLRYVASALLHLLAHGASFKTGEWAGRIPPRIVVVIGASDDEEMPRESVERLFAAAHEPKQLLWTRGGHVRPDRVEIVRQILDLARGQIASGNTDGVRPETAPQ